MILYQRIWLEENKAIGLKYVNYDFTLDLSTFTLDLSTFTLDLSTFTLDLSTFTLEIKRNRNKR